MTNEKISLEEKCEQNIKSEKQQAIVIASSENKRKTNFTYKNQAVDREGYKIICTTGFAFIDFSLKNFIIQIFIRQFYHEAF